MRLAMVGAGPWAERHAQTIANLSGVTLDAVVSTRPVNHAFGARQWCRDLASVPWSRIDGLIVASAAHSHFRLACEAIVRGVPVLMEKPLATTALEAQHISKLARRHGVLVMVALVHLFGEAFTVLRQQVSTQKIRSIRGAGGNAGPYRRDCSALWDYGPHDIGMMLALLSGRTPTAGTIALASDLRIVEARQRKDTIGGITTHVQLATSDNSSMPVTVELELGSAMEAKTRWFEVATQTGCYRYDDLAAHKLVRIRNGVSEPVTLGPGLPLGLTLQAFCTSIRARKRRHETLPLSVESCRLLERIERAAARSIELPAV